MSHPFPACLTWYLGWILVHPSSLLTLAKSEGNQWPSGTVHCSCEGATGRDGSSVPLLLPDFGMSGHDAWNCSITLDTNVSQLVSQWINLPALKVVPLFLSCEIIHFYMAYFSLSWGYVVSGRKPTNWWRIRLVLCCLKAEMVKLALNILAPKKKKKNFQNLKNLGKKMFMTYSVCSHLVGK